MSATISIELDATMQPVITGLFATGLFAWPVERRSQLGAATVFGGYST